MKPMASPLDAILDDFTRSWERGERPRVERYLGLLPAEDSAELIYHGDFRLGDLFHNVTGREYSLDAWQADSLKNATGDGYDVKGK